MIQLYIGWLQRGRRGHLFGVGNATLCGHSTKKSFDVLIETTRDWLRARGRSEVCADCWRAYKTARRAGDL